MPSAGAICQTVVKEAALYNLSTLRTQTCFRTAGRAVLRLGGCVRSEAAAVMVRARTCGTMSRRRPFSSATWRGVDARGRVCARHGR